jgi:predicted Zn-dependent peptidase
MKRLSLIIAFSSSVFVALNAQKIEFEEYKLDNGLHVILHEDKSAPLVKVEVMYNVGSKDDPKNKTGFAHFFEHLLFEGTKNIERGEWFKMVTSKGGRNNAYTSYDVTTYFEIFPSNNLQMGLWMESERMRHPVINQIGVDTQNGVIKEERRQTQDNRPYGNLISQVTKNLFPNTGYSHPIIGSIEDLDNATLQDFIDFHNTYYKPNNAVLVIAGDFDKAQAKTWIKDYFSTIPSGPAIKRNAFDLAPITSPISATFEDPNVQLPMQVLAYRTLPSTTKDAKALDLLSSILSDGKSSILYKKLVDEKKMALQIGAFNFGLKESGMYLLYGLPMQGFTMDQLVQEIDEEVAKLQNDLISENDYKKLMNQYETQFIEKNSSAEGIGNSLANNYTIYGDANKINTELDEYRSISREDIRNVARKYLQSNTRLNLRYTPKDFVEKKAEEKTPEAKTEDPVGKVVYINKDPKHGKVESIPTNPEKGVTYKVIENAEELAKWKEQNLSGKARTKGKKTKN